MSESESGVCECKAENGPGVTARITVHRTVWVVMLASGQVAEVSEATARHLVAGGFARFATLHETVGHRSPCGPVIVR